jgi:hypothetical protein
MKKDKLRELAMGLAMLLLSTVWAAKETAILSLLP